MARLLGSFATTWDLGITCVETFTFADSFGDLTGAVPRCHLRVAKDSALLLDMGAALADATGFLLDPVTRIMVMTVTALDTYLLTANLNNPGKVSGDIELRYGTGASIIVKPVTSVVITLKNRFTFFTNTEEP